MSKKVYLETLGCAKNQVDTEVMAGLLKREKFQIIDEPGIADIIIVNTCGFIESAKEESIDTIMDLLQHKANGTCSAFIVSGCLAQRYSEDLSAELPEVDAFIGTTKFDEILNIITDIYGHGLIDHLFPSPTPTIYLDDINKEFSEALPRELSTPSHYAYLKIAEGCDNFCTYCIIPKLRGKYRSRKMEDLLHEAQGLVNQGVTELVIIAQDTTMYGTDLYDKPMLSELLLKLNQIEHLKWIRLQYCYPDAINDALIEAIAACDKVVKYIDIPIQHGSDSVLKKMNRKTSRSEIISIVTKLREKVENIVIRTTVIVGFPGETDSEFEELLSLIKELKFDRLGAFKYSIEEDTPAAKFENQISEEIKQERFEKIHEIQMAISTERMYAFVGKEIEVVIEEHVEGELVYIGRSSYDTPDVDGVVYVNTEKTLSVGDYVQVKITDALEYDLIGEY